MLVSSSSHLCVLIKKHNKNWATLGFHFPWFTHLLSRQWASTALIIQACLTIFIYMPYKKPYLYIYFQFYLFSILAIFFLVSFITHQLIIYSLSLYIYFLSVNVFLQVCSVIKIFRKFKMNNSEDLRVDSQITNNNGT